MPGLAATAEYRFFGTTGTRTYNGKTLAVASSPASTAVFPTSVGLGSTYNHTIMVGLRYNFGVAPPPPPAPAPIPAAAPARSYLVFFDWDKYALTDRARQIIREAADNSTKVQYTRIEVNGYTDTSGTPKYNLGLSIRRANAVKAELIKDGVPANAITTHGFGDDPAHLLVPTGPGVREPQNRRVEIIIR
jgi:outer membrane protein OmpA-like peptidoglycan-associated protein